MQLDTIRFGTVEIEDEKILKFPDGIPGLEEYKRFAVLQFDESYPILWLQSTDDSHICLPVVDSFLAHPDYAFDLDDEDIEWLELKGPEELQVIGVLSIPDNIERMTLNLAAPIVINLTTGMARQIILNAGEYNVRTPIFHEICRLIREENADACAVKED